jgi:hypothetical protein
MTGDAMDTEEMVQRFRQRAEAVRRRNMPPVAGAERRAFIKQAEIDYQDFAIIADAKVSLNGGVLTVDLRPAICDATLRNSPDGIIDKTAERETQVAMENIASALPTDGDKIKMSQLDSGADLRALVEDSKRFLTVVKEIKPIDITLCPGFSLTHGYLA